MMSERLTLAALRHRFLVLTLLLVLIGGGLYSSGNLPLIAVPDVTNVVTINTNAGVVLAGGRAADHLPRRAGSSGLPNVERVRSLFPWAVSSDSHLPRKDGHLLRAPDGGRAASSCPGES